MKFKQDAEVRTRDGENAGNLSHVVMDPRTHEVTHLVVQKGFLFKDDKVVPMDMVARAADDRIELSVNEEGLKNLPDYEETYYVSEPSRIRTPEAYAPAIYWYPPSIHGAYLGAHYAVQTHKNIPPETVALQEGAKVTASDDKHVGDVEEILTDAETGKADGFVISKGIFLPEKKLVPVSWASQIHEDEVRLAVSSSLVENLRPYDKSEGVRA